MDPALYDLLGQSAVDVAPSLLGWTFATNIGGERTAVRLTEVEAYMGRDDPASHAFRGRTTRNAPMFSAGGVIYVYFIYGMHHAVNIVTGGEGDPGAVLLRGGDPIEGIDVMVRRRGRTDHLTDGPGKLAQALGLTREHDGLALGAGVVDLAPGEPPEAWLATPRVGISRAAERPWRFVIARGA